MKKLTKIIALLGIILFISSCEDEDKSPFLRVTNNAPGAAVLRTINITSALGQTANANGGSYQFSNLDASIFELELEYQDAQNGELLDNVAVTLSFDDRSELNGDGTAEPDPDTGRNGNDVAARPLTTLTPSDFTRDPVTNLPRTTLSLTASEAEALLGLDRATQVAKGDIYRLEFVLTRTNGQVFSSDNLEGNITGPFFNSPFSYPIPIGPQPFKGKDTDSISSSLTRNQLSLVANGKASNTFADGDDSGDIVFVAPSGFEAIGGVDIQFVKLDFTGEPLFNSYGDAEQAKIDFEEGTPVSTVQVAEDDVYAYKIDREGVDFYGALYVGEVETDDEGVTIIPLIFKENKLL